MKHRYSMGPYLNRQLAEPCTTLEVTYRCTDLGRATTKGPQASPYYTVADTGPSGGIAPPHKGPGLPRPLYLLSGLSMWR